MPKVTQNSTNITSLSDPLGNIVPGDTMSILDDPTITKLLQDIAIKENLRDARMQIDKGAKKGDGYLSEMTIVQITSPTDDGDGISVIIKCAQRDPKQRTTFPTHQLYLREVRFYEQTLPAFVAFQSVHQVREPFAHAPKYYAACTLNEKEFLIMQNLRAAGFTLYNRTQPFDTMHALALLKIYAKMHAVSFAMRHHEPQRFAELSHDMENLFVPKYVERGFFESFELAVAKAATWFDAVTEARYNKRLRDYRAEVLPFFTTVAKSDWEHGVITHGDCWMRNMMFRYEEDDQHLVEVKLLDFQIMRFVSPVLDVAYLVYMNTDKSFYGDYQTFLDYYHAELLAHGKEMKTDIGRVYPMRALQNEWLQYAQYGLLFGLIGVGILLADEKDMVDLSDLTNDTPAADVFFIDNNSIEARRRMRNLAQHFIDNGFI